MPDPIDVILPALDEEAAITGVLGGLPPGFRPIVVDNGSRDRTAAVAASLGATVVREDRRGFGAACFAGLRAATSDVVCFMDCDGSFAGVDLARVAAPVRDDRADLVLGRRRPVTLGAWVWHARAANRALTATLSWRSGVRLADLGPMRAARREALLELAITDRRFGWPLEMVVLAARQRWRIVEVDVAYLPRIGRSKVTGTVAGTARTVYDMAQVLR